MSRPVARLRIGAIATGACSRAPLWRIRWNNRAEKHLRVVVPGRLIRGAWQSPAALRAIIARERIKTIVTLTAINRDDPKYVEQAKVVAETGVNWLIVPMRGSRATLEQMAQAADLLADPATSAGLFPLCRRPSPHQSGPRGLLDPTRGMDGRGGLEGSGQPSLGSTDAR